MENETAKFPFGSKVILNNNVAGIVLYSYNMFSDKRHFLYRIIVDANDLCYRVYRNNVDQANEKDQHLFAEDFDNLIGSTEHLFVIEASEDVISLFDGEVTPFGLPY